MQPPNLPRDNASKAIRGMPPAHQQQKRLPSAALLCGHHPGRLRVLAQVPVSYRWSTGAKEHMTAVRVTELDGMLVPQPLTLRASCLKAPPGAFVFIVERNAANSRH